MINLGKYKLPHSEMLHQEKENFCRNVAENAYASSGLQGGDRAAKWFNGFITIEDTPKNEYGEKLVKAMFYVNDPHTRHGYHAKFEITEKGLVSV